jgi:hypothetical protein
MINAEAKINAIKVVEKENKAIYFGEMKIKDLALDYLAILHADEKLIDKSELYLLNNKSCRALYRQGVDNEISSNLISLIVCAMNNGNEYNQGLIDEAPKIIENELIKGSAWDYVSALKVFNETLIGKFGIKIPDRINLPQDKIYKIEELARRTDVPIDNALEILLKDGK